MRILVDTGMRSIVGAIDIQGMTGSHGKSRAQVSFLAHVNYYCSGQFR